MDSAAANCHFVPPPDDIGELPDDAIAREGCRRMFVLTGLEDAATP